MFHLIGKNAFSPSNVIVSIFIAVHCFDELPKIKESEKLLLEFPVRWSTMIYFNLGQVQVTSSMKSSQIISVDGSWPTSTMATRTDKNFPACNDQVDLRSHRIITLKLEVGNRSSRRARGKRRVRWNASLHKYRSHAPTVVTRFVLSDARCLHDQCLLILSNNTTRQDATRNSVSQSSIKRSARIPALCTIAGPAITPVSITLILLFI